MPLALVGIELGLMSPRLLFEGEPSAFVVLPEEEDLLLETLTATAMIITSNMMAPIMMNPEDRQYDCHALR